MPIKHPRSGCVPAPQAISPDTPLRLGIAVALAYPDGSMSAAGLRREWSAGRLVVEVTGGKEYTTLAFIERMRERCRVQPPGAALKAALAIADGIQKRDTDHSAQRRAPKPRRSRREDQEREEP